MNIQVIQGDITTMEVDVVVNAANSSLLGGGGVDGAIHRAGGPAILKECQEIRQRQGGCPTGEAVMTTAGNMKAHRVIHTVGPVWNGGKSNEAAKLYDCYWNSLRLAEEAGFNTIAFPNISTGIYGYPKVAAAEIAMKAISAFTYHHLEQIHFVCFDPENYIIYKKLLKV